MPTNAEKQKSYRLRKLNQVSDLKKQIRDLKSLNNEYLRIIKQLTKKDN